MQATLSCGSRFVTGQSQPLAQLNLPPRPETSLVRINFDSKEDVSIPRGCLKWINIVKPDEKVLHLIARKFEIKYDDLAQSLESDRPPTSYRYKNYLVCHFDELSFDPNSPHNLTNTPVSAVLNDKFLITITPHETKCLLRVKNEITAGDVSIADINSSNYLFSRIIGSALHYSEDSIAKFEKATSSFCDREGGSLPELEHQSTVSLVRNSITRGLHSLQRYTEIIASLREESNLFGATKPRDSLGRYEGMLGGARQSLDQSSKTTDELRRTWREKSDEWRNESLDRLEYLGAAILIPALVAQVLSIDFINSSFSTGTIIGSLAGAALVSACLVGNLIHKKKVMHEGFLDNRKY